MEKIIQIQWACKEIEEARSVVSLLIRDHLVACVNIFPHIESHFFWEGECKEESEVKVLLKTTLKAFERVKEVIEERSSYDVPEITYLILDGGNQSYLEWVEQNVQA